MTPNKKAASLRQQIGGHTPKGAIVTTNIIEQTEPERKLDQIIRWIISIDPATDLRNIPDGIYPFDYLGTDKWAVVVNEAQIAWGRDYGVVCVIYAEALRVKREHIERNPANAAISASWYTVNNGVDDFQVNRETGEVTL